MKRSECTVETLKDLGYTVKHIWYGSWCNAAKELSVTPKQEGAVFKLFAEAIRDGNEVKIVRNDVTYTVSAYISAFDFSQTPTHDTFFISRPMTDAERVEADLITGRGKTWEYKIAE